MRLSEARGYFLFSLLVLQAFVPALCGFAQNAPWVCMTPGGGGCFRGPVVSPHDSNLILTANDMGASFRSTDGGRNWEMISHSNLRQFISNVRYPSHIWTFHPTDPNVIFVGTFFGLNRSNDAGKTWKPVPGHWDMMQPAPGAEMEKGPRIVAFDRGRPDIGMAYFRKYGKDLKPRLFLTKDRGTTWQPLPWLPDQNDKQDGEVDRIINLVFDPSHPGRVFAANKKSVYRSEDDGQNWIRVGTGLPQLTEGECIYDLDGGSDGERSILYVTMSSRHEEDTLLPNFYRSDDAGKTWKPVEGEGLFRQYSEHFRQQPHYQRLAVCATQPDHLYVAFSGAHQTDDPDSPANSTIFHSTDGGRTFQRVFWPNKDSALHNIQPQTWIQSKGNWGWWRAPLGLAVSETDPNAVALSTWSGVYVSHDAGRNWIAGFAKPIEGERQPSGGMPMLTVWDYVVDPKHMDRHYLASTDFASWVSRDAGKTWKYRPDGNPWFNNVYAYAFDPSDSDRIWAASSTTHDIPIWRYLPVMANCKGGVAFSDDAGMNWRPVGQGKGLPCRAMTDLIAVARPGEREPALYVAAMGAGIFSSTDGGESWRNVNFGIAADNRNLLRVRQGPDGRLYALATIKLKDKDRFIPGTLYVSDDMGASWKSIFQRKDVPFPVDVTFDPSNPGTVYLSCMERERFQGEAGLWRSQDSGETWECIYAEPCFSVTVDPADSNRLYLASWKNLGGGLRYSTDHGKTWAEDSTFPFWRPLRIVADLRDSSQLYVTTFGCGVWHGPAPGINPSPSSSPEHGSDQ